MTGRHISKSFNVQLQIGQKHELLHFPADTTGAFDDDSAAEYAISTLWLNAGSQLTTSGTINSQHAWA